MCVLGLPGRLQGLPLLRVPERCDGRSSNAYDASFHDVANAASCIPGATRSHATCDVTRHDTTSLQRVAW
jgi:hypothetical protein